MLLNKTALVMSASLLAFAVMVSGCAAPLPPSPEAQPTIPPPPVVTAPRPSGDYWIKHCALVRSVLEALKLPPTIYAECLGLGQ